mgnify:CR=1 FL=1
MLGLHLINAGLSPEISWLSGGALSHEQESECIPNLGGCGLYSLPLLIYKRRDKFEIAWYDEN